MNCVLKKNVQFFLLLFMFEVVTAERSELLFRIMLLCSLVGAYHSFGLKCRLRSTVKMKERRSSKMKDYATLRTIRPQYTIRFIVG
jgi:hypothetical protein